MAERHPHFGTNGVVAKVSDSSEVRLIKLDNGKSAYVYDPAALKRL